MLVTVHALFSNSHLIGAQVIAKGTAHLEPTLPQTSHVAVLINNRWVHEATGAGVNIISYQKWLELHQEVGRVELKSREYQEIADQFRSIQGKKYDYLGVFFLGLCIIPTFIGIKLPAKNQWESKKKFFCCEVLGYLTGMYYGMSSPIQIMASLLKD
jgi:hypothetical protein